MSYTQGTHGIAMDTKKLAKKWFTEVWNKKNVSTIELMMAPDAVGFTEGGKLVGPAQFRSLVFEPFVAALPDLKVTIAGIIADKNEAVIRWTASGTHNGALMDIAPTGRPVKFSGMTWLKFSRGKIIAGSDSYNLHGLIAYLTTGTPSASVTQ